MPKYNKHGEEILDGTPVEVPVRFRNRPLTTVEEAMKALSLASMIAEREGMETFEESLDFGEEGDELLQGSADFSEMDEVEVLNFMRAAEEELQMRKSKKDEKPPEAEKKPAETGSKAG